MQNPFRNLAPDWVYLLADSQYRQPVLQKSSVHFCAEKQLIIIIVFGGRPAREPVPPLSKII